jgi:hypothetical protein
MARIIFLLALFSLAVSLEVDRVTLKDGRVIDGAYNQAEGFIEAITPNGKVRMRLAADAIVSSVRVSIPDAPPPAPEKAAGPAASPQAKETPPTPSLPSTPPTHRHQPTGNSEPEPDATCGGGTAVAIILLAASIFFFV